ncbi:uncharacterized protein UHOD_11610 [Ustilago sp. UG-2017b]|nr:uncharacterized protein UHOD_11610 [Ustilago sp. UG-2017b]
MPFGLTNAPASFQHLMNDTFKDMLDRSLIIYLDDLLIYSSTLEQHQGHVSAILARLRQAGLYAKAEKCQFSTSQTEFLGFVVSDQGVSMDPSKTEVITNWPVPKSVHDVQVFLGFCNFYRKFIPQYSRTAYPLTQLLRKEAQSAHFAWNNEAQHAFEQLRSAFGTDTILRHFDPTRPIIVETDASDFAVAAVLSQSFDQGTRHPIAFFSKKLDPAQLNYPIFDKEMFAIVAAFKHWRQYLEGAKFPVQVLTDHRSLEYFTTTKQLNRRQARWLELLSDFDFVIQYRPGAQAGLPGTLTRRSDMRPMDKGPSLMQEHNPNNFQALLKPHQLRLAATGILTVKSDITDKIRDALSSDSWTSALLEQAHLGSPPLGFAINSMNLLTYRDSVCVPDVDNLRLLIVQDQHNSPSVGHPGRRKTLSLVRRSFFWPGISPSSMVLIEQLPPSSDFTAILVVVNRLTKMATFVPTTNTLDAPELAKLFLHHVYSKHGLPTSIVSDRGSEFTSHFWRSLSALLGIENHFSSAYHPQSDGQTERVNQVLEQYLRGYSNHLQTNWSDLLPLAEFSYNNAEHASTQLTPFFANYGYHPRFSFDNTDSASPALFPAARSYTDQLEQLHEYVHGELDKANSQSAGQFDKHHLPSPQFQPGDRVWLSADNIRSLRPTKKLDYRRLGPFPISEGRFVIGSISLDFIEGLPPSRKYDSILVIVDRLTKFAILAPTYKTVTAKQTAALLYGHMVRLFGYPDHMVSDRGRQFISGAWKAFAEQMGVKHSLSTAYHPQTDGQTERVNQVVEQYLRMYCNYEQDDWADLLDTAAFVYNNTVHNSIGVSPFFACYGWNPKAHPDIPQWLGVNDPDRFEYLIDGKERCKYLQEQIREAQHRTVDQYNRKRKDIEFKVGDMVYINRRNWKTRRPTPKLDTRFTGPYPVQERPVKTSSLPHRTDQPIIPSLPDEDLDFEVEALIDKRSFNGTTEYKVLWRGYSEEAASWEPVENLSCPDLIQEYEVLEGDEQAEEGVVSRRSREVVMSSRAFRQEHSPRQGGGATTSRG